MTLSKAGLAARTIKKIAPLVTVSDGAAAAAAATSTKASTPASEASPAAPSQPASAAPTKTASSSTAQGTPGPGMVWVNTSSGEYHRQGDRWYGKTKQGKFMTEDDAIRAGYHAAKESGGKK
jgi:hypothetical protein